MSRGQLCGRTRFPTKAEGWSMLKIIRAKLHAIRVTGADLNYHGSITLDPEHCTEAGIYPLEFVEIWNKHSGARLTTYVIYGEPGSRCCVLNGAAARTCQVRDEVIIAVLRLPPRCGAAAPAVDARPEPPRRSRRPRAR